MNYETLDIVLAYLNEEIISEESMIILKNKPKIYNKETICSTGGKENTIYFIDVDGKRVPARARAEMLIIKNDSVYIVEGKSISSLGLDYSYRIPGGGIENSESGKDTAIRETQEEAYINTKDVDYGGCYISQIDQIKDWVKKEIPKKYQWKSYYVEVYIGKYNGKYKGKVDEEDKEESMTQGKFIKISEIFGKLNPIHQQAIIKYLKNVPIN